MARFGFWVALAAVVLLTMSVVPAMGGKPGGSTPPVDTGTIYYGSGGVNWSMTPDGSNKTELSVKGAASEILHGGKRWFLTMMALGADETYPWGHPRYELFAVTDEGDEVQLTDAEYIEPNWRAADGSAPAWATDSEVADGKVSYLAVQWAYDDIAEEWYVDTESSGLFTLALDWDAILGVSGTWAPGTPVLESALVLATYEADFGSDSDPDIYTLMSVTYDWSPDGTQVAYLDRGDADQKLHVATIDGSSLEVDLVTLGYHPRWSANNVIAFQSLEAGSIQTISSSGSGLKTIVAAPGGTTTRIKQVDYPVWSPAGTHLVYWYYDSQGSKGGKKFVIYRIAADGSGQTSLASNSTGLSPKDWVGE